MTVAENPIPDPVLVPYGFIRGTIATSSWCVVCGRIVVGLHPKAFKCRPCAVDQYRSVERATKTK
jgi:hypothetical protein